MKRATHTTFHVGKRVIVTMTNGTKFIDRYAEKRSGSVVFVNHGRVQTRMIKNISIFKDRGDANHIPS